MSLDLGALAPSARPNTPHSREGPLFRGLQGILPILSNTTNAERQVFRERDAPFALAQQPGNAHIWGVWQGVISSFAVCTIGRGYSRL